MASNAIKRVFPLLDRVLVQKMEAASKTESGVVIPEKGRIRIMRGTIVAIGPGCRNDQGEIVPVNLKVGDNVLLPDYGGSRVELEDNKKYHIFREAEILAKVE